VTKFIRQNNDYTELNDIKPIYGRLIAKYKNVRHTNNHCISLILHLSIKTTKHAEHIKRHRCKKLIGKCVNKNNKHFTFYVQ
jgi:hypothetical protein